MERCCRARSVTKNPVRTHSCMSIACMQYHHVVDLGAP